MTHPISAESAPQCLPRLLSTVDLAQPLHTLEPLLLRWASASGWILKTVDAFEALAKAMEQQPALSSEDTTLDLRLAVDAWQALRRRPPSGFLGYVMIWQSRMSTQRALGVGDEGRLRALQHQLGGILLDGKAAPYILLCPQPDGTWMQMGFESVVLLDRSPLDEQRKRARVVRIHQLPAADRRYLRTE